MNFIDNEEKLDEILEELESIESLYNENVELNTSEQIKDAIISLRKHTVDLSKLVLTNIRMINSLLVTQKCMMVTLNQKSDLPISPHSFICKEGEC